MADSASSQSDLGGRSRRGARRLRAAFCNSGGGYMHDNDKYSVMRDNDRANTKSEPVANAVHQRSRADIPLPGSWQPLRYWELDELGLACLSKISAVHVTRCPA